MTNLHFFLLFFILIEALANEFCRPCLVQQCEFFCLTCFQKQKAEATRLVPRVLKNLNMTEKMSSNPGLTCAVTWKSCSDCKAAWVSILLLHGLSVTWDKLPNTVRAPVDQVHYNNTAEPDYRWQLSTGKHVLCCTAAALSPFLACICMKTKPKRPRLHQVHSSYTWWDAWGIKKPFKLLIFPKEWGRNSDS